MRVPAAPLPDVSLELTWEGGLRFAGKAEDARVTLDGSGKAGPSPVQALAFALAGCMAADVVDILAKGRLSVGGLRAHLRAWRAPEPPRRLVTVELSFVVIGNVPPDRVERAIALSRERYCSVWHSLRPDIAFATAFEIQSAG
jgi:putative redox protein